MPEDQDVEKLLECYSPRPTPGAFEEGELPPHPKQPSLHSNDAKYCYDCRRFHPPLVGREEV
jgi:hypothetical protein